MTHPPTLWRELSRGMQAAPDVRAAQRGLRRAGTDLGFPAGNARNGNYGEGTARDVELFRKATGIGKDPDVIGAELWAALWPYVDASGAVAFCNQPEAIPTPSPRPKRLPIIRGHESKGVEAAQRALWRALPDSTNIRNGVYGKETSADVVRFRERYAVNAGDSGDSIGGELWNVLTRWMDSKAAALVDAWTPDNAIPDGTVGERAVTRALAEVGYQEGSGNTQKYGQWYGWDRVAWCAIFVTWAADPSGSEAFSKGDRYAFCPYVVADARAGKNAMRTVPAAQAKRGDAVLYDWRGDGISDHIGLVVEGPGIGSSFHTVEGNTSAGQAGSQSNGDGVYQRTRYVGDVIEFVRFG